MNPLRHLASISTLISAIILSLLPICVAIDFGGVLWWTQYVAGLAIALAFVLALTSLLDWGRYTRPRQLLVIVPLLLWLAYSAFQTVTLPPSIVAMLSPGSHTAYTDWLEPILPASELPQSFPISIAQDDSIHAVAWFGMIAVLAWASLRVFNTRARLIILLSCIAITGAVVSILGIVGLMLPDIPFFETIHDASGVHFSTFVNRNNAALTMNIGLAASFGLLSWRLSALTGQELDGKEFEFNDIFSLTSDRDSAIGVLCTVLCFTGLLVCGSRGGLATVLFASLLSLGWIRQRRGFSTIPVVLFATMILAALLTLPLQLDLESIKRMQLFSDSSQTIINDGRFDHWPESWQTTLEYLPGGSGLSTYQNAYLPYQNETPKAWFVHADNLWLELLVEQGIFGISFAILLLLVCVGCLQRMASSHDALDHGLRVAGWYCVGTVLFSQVFDFGLVIPANLLVVTTLLCVIVTRSVDSDLVQPNKSNETQSLLAKLMANPLVPKATLALQAAVLVLLIPAAYLYSGTLRQDAVADTLVRRTDQELQTSSASIDVLQTLEDEMSTILQSGANAKLSQSLAQVQHQIGRLQEVTLSEPSNAEEAKELYKATSSKYRRLAGQSPSEFVKKYPAGIDKLQTAQPPTEYTEAVQNYASLLSRSPLDRSGRQGLLYLDFISSEPDAATDGNDQRTSTLLTQLSDLYRSSPVQLKSIANLAAQSQENAFAASLWKRAMTGPNWRIFNTMKAIKNYKNISLIDTLPENKHVIRAVAGRVMKTRDQENYKTLPLMVEKFDCDSCEKTDEKAECLQLAGDALVRTEQHQESLAYYEQALEIRPSSSDLRLKYISSLRKLDMGREALTQARLGRQIDSTDKRFDAVIKKMASLEIGGS